MATTDFCSDFRATALLVLAVLRIARLAERRTRGQRAPFLIRPMPPSPEPRLQPRAPTILPLPWPRLVKKAQRPYLYIK